MVRGISMRFVLRCMCVGDQLRICNGSYGNSNKPGVARSRWRTGGARISSLFSWFRACVFVSSVNFRSFGLAAAGAYGFCL